MIVTARAHLIAKVKVVLDAWLRSAMEAAIADGAALPDPDALTILVGSSPDDALAVVQNPAAPLLVVSTAGGTDSYGLLNDVTTAWTIQIRAVTAYSGRSGEQAANLAVITRDVLIAYLRDPTATVASAIWNVEGGSTLDTSATVLGESTPQFWQVSCSVTAHVVTLADRGATWARPVIEETAAPPLTMGDPAAWSAGTSSGTFALMRASTLEIASADVGEDVALDFTGTILDANGDPVAWSAGTVCYVAQTRHGQQAALTLTSQACSVPSLGAIQTGDVWTVWLQDASTKQAASAAITWTVA